MLRLFSKAFWVLNDLCLLLSKHDITDIERCQKMIHARWSEALDNSKIHVSSEELLDFNRASRIIDNINML